MACDLDPEASPRGARALSVLEQPMEPRTGLSIATLTSSASVMRHSMAFQGSTCYDLEYDWYNHSPREVVHITLRYAQPPPLEKSIAYPLNPAQVVRVTHIARFKYHLESPIIAARKWKSSLSFASWNPRAGRLKGSMYWRMIISKATTNASSN